MKHKLKFLIHRFASWLWFKTYEPTATELAILHGLKYRRYKYDFKSSTKKGKGRAQSMMPDIFKIKERR